MKVVLLISLLTSILILGCRKEKSIEPYATNETEQWEQFVGDYQVYDTTGLYLYDMSISKFFSGENIYSNDVDSLMLTNFADTFDLRMEYQLTLDDGFLNIGFHDSITDHNGKSWKVTSKLDDAGTPEPENTLTNDSITLYFKMTNLPYYILEAVPFYDCDCKHVAVKQ